ncbi:MAG: heavy-metal-associated domain-containing protein, partial [Actinomycetota bacterium]|nr:heavy-metal-associated domain-containing protein [Actinomycetota bacterium]
MTDAYGSATTASTVLHVGGMYRGSEKNVVEQVLSHRPGVISVEANPVAQTANVTFDTAKTSVAELRRWVQDCGFHCAGQSVPEHICDPLLEPDPSHETHGHAMHEVTEAPAPNPEHTGHAEHMSHERTAPPDEHAGHEMAAGEVMRSPQDAMGHGGHAGMSMDAMVRDMRNRFLVAALLSIPIVLWSPIG